MYVTLLKESAWNRLNRTALKLSVFCGTVVNVMFFNMFTRQTHGCFQKTRLVLVRQNSTLLSLEDIPEVNVSNVNCTALFSNDTAEMKKANELKSSNLARSTSSIEYVKQASNCDVYIKKRRYLTSPVNDEEADFPLAFSILLYKDFEQFERLLRAIYRPQNIYCVHVDKKSPTAIKDAVRLVAACFDNVFVSPKLYNVQWGKFTVLAPELTCMEELLRRHKKWKYFINLTGQEFPLKTNWQIVRMLKAFDGANNIAGTIRRRNENRYAGSWPAPFNITVTKGPVHIIATRGFVDFAVNNGTALKILEWVKKTRIPDETYFSTLNHNPQLGVPGSYRGNLLTSRSFHLLIDRMLVNEIRNPAHALAAHFAAFYVFNMVYTPSASVTLEFIQRFIVGINPERGSKTKKPGKHHHDVNPKLLNLINSIAAFEWAV